MKAIRKQLWVFVLGLAVVAVVGASGSADNRFMRQKLEHSQRVLEGLTTEDFAKIQKGADAMAVLSQAAGWQVLRTPDYIRYSTDFQALAQRLSRAAQEKNLDAAALAYLELTMNCVNCHKHVRAIRTAQIPPRGEKVAVREREEARRF